tara:strand:+ start:208 stop:630 length:423 start_codon:yes stop_codon:yes gene_type:complete
LEPIRDGRADVVYGLRFLGEPHRVLFFWHYLGNVLLTTLSNMFTNLNLSDMETGYKVFKRSVLDSITLKCNRFGFEPEFTIKIARNKLHIYEVPVSYSGRDYSEGKKSTGKTVSPRSGSSSAFASSANGTIGIGTGSTST